jgi:uncharacterized protein
MVKPVSGRCNLNCRYCYYLSKPAELYPSVEEPMMSPATLEAFTCQYLQAMPRRCEFAWQGGEPLLAGIEFFRAALNFQRGHRLDGQSISNALQTNGTLLDDAWCDLLAEHKFLVGISLDGPPAWHDRFRTDGAGRGSFHRAWGGLERLARRGVEFNVLATLNRANAPHGGGLYRYFVNRGARYLQFIPVLERQADGTIADFSITAQQYERFLLEVFEQWISRDVGSVSERFIDSVLHTLMFGRSAMCCFDRVCANAYVLEFNGDLYACDHFVYEPWRLGNIHDRPLADILAGNPRLGQFEGLKADLPRHCRDCPHLEFCNAGCPKHHVPIGADPRRRNYFCRAYRGFFDRALPALRRLSPCLQSGSVPGPAQMSQIIASAGLRRVSPLADMTMPQAGAPSRGGVSVPRRPKTPGRNDPCPCGSGRKHKNCCGRG